MEFFFIILVLLFVSNVFNVDKMEKNIISPLSLYYKYSNINMVVKKVGGNLSYTSDTKIFHLKLSGKIV